MEQNRYTPLHSSCLVIELENIRGNVRHILNGLSAGQAIIPILKDNAYGLGLVEIAGLLCEFPQVKTLAVSQVGEGVDLRRAGIEREILVLGGTADRFIPVALEHDLTLTVGRPGLALLIGQGASEIGKQGKIEVKIETGLNRIGLKPGKELDDFGKELETWKPNLKITGAFSHFADLEDKVRTQRQFQCFLEGTQQLQKAGILLPRRHICGSEASEYYPQYGLEALRIGRRLYMDHPTKPLGGIREVASWRSWITNLRTLQAGELLGYGGRFRLEQDTQVATVGVGYGDGLNQSLVQAGGPVLVRGERAKLLACCMDQCFLDVTGFGCQPDDEVTFFGWDETGGYLSSQEVSLLVGHEEGCGLISALGGRVDRIYQS